MLLLLICIQLLNQFFFQITSQSQLKIYQDQYEIIPFLNKDLQLKAYQKLFIFIYLIIFTPIALFRIFLILFSGLILLALEFILLPLIKTKKLFWQFLANIVCFIVFIPKQKINKKKSHIIISNHISMFDAYILFYIYGCRFIAKDTLKRKFIIQYISFCLKTIYISRTKINYNLQEQISKELNIDYPICFYPEGSVTNQEVLLEFRIGAFKYQNAIIQPTIIQLNSLFRMTGHQNPFLLVLKIFYNPFIVVQVTYLNQLCNTQEYNEQLFANMARYIMAKRGNLFLSNYSVNDMLYFFKNKDYQFTYIQKAYNNIRWNQYYQYCKNMHLSPWYQYTYQQITQNSLTSQK